MLEIISEQLRKKFKVFSLTDNLMFRNKVIEIKQEYFKEINCYAPDGKSVAFVDGGQGDILIGGNVHLGFIRIGALVMSGNDKISFVKHEFYVLTTAVYKNGEIWYQGNLFDVSGGLLIDEGDLLISSMDSSIRSGNERAPITRVAAMARRFAELALAGTINADFVVVDGTFDLTFAGEEKYFRKLGYNAASLAKTCTLFTTNGNNPTVLLARMSPVRGAWSYYAEGRSFFVKLHPRAAHVFRFEGCEEILAHLAQNSCDALFIGYPYGLTLVDQLVRVSNAERNSLKMKLLLREENRELVDYIRAVNAHEILDSLG